MAELATGDRRPKVAQGEGLSKSSRDAAMRLDNAVAGLIENWEMPVELEGLSDIDLLEAMTDLTRET